MGLKNLGESFNKKDEAQTVAEEPEQDLPGQKSVLPDVWTADEVWKHITLFEDQVLVEHIAPPTKTKGGLHLPHGSEMVKNLENQLYRVLVVGPGRNLGTEHEKVVKVKPGDLAIVRRTAAISFCQEQRDYYIISDNDVVGVVTGVEAVTDNPE